jgi:hypothetical protein
LVGLQWVLPEIRLAGLLYQLSDFSFLPCNVKDAPLFQKFGAANPQVFLFPLASFISLITPRGIYFITCPSLIQDRISSGFFT